MKIQKRQINLILALHQLRNINLDSKGWYRIKIQAYSTDKFMNVRYCVKENMQKHQPQLQKNMSIKAQFNSDEETTKNQPSFQSVIQNEQQNTTSFYTLPFYVKYHCQAVKLKSLCLFSQAIRQQLISMRLTLQRKQTKSNQISLFEPVQTIQLKIDCKNHFLQMKDILMFYPECFSLKISVLNCPILSFQQILSVSQNAIKSNTSYIIRGKRKQQQLANILLAQLRKTVKKERYQTFILKKQMNQIFKNSNQTTSITLPSHFIEKQNICMDQVSSSELNFFKYLAFYERYNITSDMLKQQIQHINFEKLSLIKNFIDSFQKEEIMLSLLEQRHNLFCQKKYKQYIIKTQKDFNSLSQLVLNQQYSQGQNKHIKSKIKELDRCIYQGRNLNQNIFQTAFNISNQKNIKKHNNNVKMNNQIIYPIIFKNIFNITDKIYKNCLKAENIVNLSSQKKNRKKKKYFIFAHGFQGLPIDLSFLVNMIKFSNQKIKILVLKSYKSNMVQSIQIMASKVANQINYYFTKVDLKEIQPQISFIGHSMGSIILRAAFKQMKSIQEYFSMFISICSPHLGYIQGTKFLTQTGLSLISKLKPIVSLNQLSNRDNNNIEKTFIYNLSKQGTLSYFKRLILIACMEDDYVPWHSARIQPFGQQGSKCKIEKQMIQNILGVGSQSSSRLQRIERIQINFPQQKQKSLNTFIGRSSHIKPLNDRGFLQILAKQIIKN